MDVEKREFKWVCYKEWLFLKGRYNTGYLEHLNYSLDMKSPSVMSGLKEKEDEPIKTETKVVVYNEGM